MERRTFLLGGLATLGSVALAGPMTSPATPGGPDAPGAAPAWPPRPDVFKPGVSGRPGTDVDISLAVEDGRRRVVMRATGDQARPPRPDEPLTLGLYLQTFLFFGRGAFLGVQQEFNESGAPLSAKASWALPDPPIGADEVIVRHQTAAIDRKEWPEEAFSEWFRGTWWHFATAVPTADGCCGRGKGGTRMIVTPRPVDQDLVGWVRACGMRFAEGVAATARLPLG